jgi:PAS domain S-box-containing protein
LSYRESIGGGSAGGAQDGEGSPDLARLFDVSHDFLCIVDEQGRFRTVSASSERILGYRPEELIGREFADFLHPDDLKRTMAKHQALVSGADVLEFENRYLRKDGSVVHLDWCSSWLSEARLSYSIARDVSERKRLEAQRKAEYEVVELKLARFEMAQGIARLGYWEHHIGSDEMQTYGETSAILGVPDTQPIKLSALLAHVVEEDRQGVMDACEQAERASAADALDFRVKRPDGSIRHVRAERRLVQDKNGKAVRVIGTLQDVTERREAERERQRYTQQLALLAQAARQVNSPLTTQDLLDGITATARELVDSRLAAAEASLGGERLYAGVHSEKHSSIDPLAMLRNAESAQALSIRLVAASGRPIGLLRVAEKRAGPFTVDDERVLTQLADLAAVGLERAHLYADLERRVRERIRELEEFNRELEAFSYSVSHDLRGPLRAIAGFTGLLRERYYDTIDEDGRRYIDRVLAGTERMSRLIEDWLTLGRVSRVEIRRESVDMSALAQTILSSLKEAAPQRVAKITVEPGIRVQGDRRLMETVLENLLDNAWKFTAGRPETRIRFGRKRLPGGEEALFVEDNGVGFDPSQSASVFRLFQRLHDYEEFPGTGVGLATVQRIVQRHGGRVWAEAKEGRGAVFYFTVPEAAAQGGQ